MLGLSFARCGRSGEAVADEGESPLAPSGIVQAANSLIRPPLTRRPPSLASVRRMRPRRNHGVSTSSISNCRRSESRCGQPYRAKPRVCSSSATRRPIEWWPTFRLCSEPAIVSLSTTHAWFPRVSTGRRHRAGTVAKIEATLHKREVPDIWRAFIKPAKKLADGETVQFGSDADPPRRGLPRARGGGRGRAPLCLQRVRARPGAGAARRHAATSLHFETPRGRRGRSQPTTKPFSRASRGPSPRRRRVFTSRQHSSPRSRRGASRSCA